MKTCVWEQYERMQREKTKVGLVESVDLMEVV